jgi:hypothetical protein
MCICLAQHASCQVQLALKCNLAHLPWDSVGGAPAGGLGGLGTALMTLAGVGMGDGTGEGAAPGCMRAQGCGGAWGLLLFLL